MSKQLLRATATGEIHGLINEVGNSVPFDDFKHFTPANKAKAEKLKKEESKIVKARYINHKGMMNRLEKPYCRWAGDNIQFWRLIPGEVYDLPMGFVNEVNSAVGLAQRSERVDANGVPSKRDSAPEREHELVPLSF